MEVIYALMDKGFECVYAGNSIWYVYVEDKIVAEVNELSIVGITNL